MDDLCGVDVFESSEQLVEEELVVLLGEGLVALDDLREVGVHHLRDHIAG